MSGGSRLAQRIALTKKAREKNPRPQAKTLERAGWAAMKRNARANIDVLLTIEGTFVRCWSQDDRIDDAVVWSVLRWMILEDPPSIMPHAWLFSELLLAREAGREVDAETWTECLRVVKDSVERHSTRQSGDCSYLLFVEATMDSE